MANDEKPDLNAEQTNDGNAQDSNFQDNAAHDIPSEGNEEEAVAGGQQSGAGDAEDEIENLKAKLATAQEDVLRAQAEVQNIRRRAEMDVEKAHKFGLEKFVSDLLVVVDNLERALASIDSSDESESTKAVTEGVELTLKSFLDTLQKHNVEAINPAGEPFDPQLHQAMTTVESKDVEPNTVIDVFQKGYTLHGRLVRPAMVVVSKAAIEA